MRVFTCVCLCFHMCMAREWTGMELGSRGRVCEGSQEYFGNSVINIGVGLKAG